MAKILNVPLSAMSKDIHIVDIFDEYDFILVMYHYKDNIQDIIDSGVHPYSESEIKNILSVRGKLICIEDECVVCASYPITKDIPMCEVGKDGFFLSPPAFVSSNGTKVSKYSEENKYNKYIVGTVIRHYKVRGFSFFSTHKKVIFDRSKFQSDRTFKEIFFDLQNSIDSIQGLFKNNMSDEEERYVHTFILSSNTLNMDSRHLPKEKEAVYYITTFKLEDNNAIVDIETEEKTTALIKRMNEHCSKPIRFPEILSPEEVNRVLNPNGVILMSSDHDMTIEQINENINDMGRNYAIDYYFQDSEKIIVRTDNNEIFSLVPKSSKRRITMIDGKLNTFKIFCDCIGLFTNGKIYKEKIFLRFGFSFEQLNYIKDNYDHFKTNKLSELEEMDLSLNEVIMTNIFFSVPIEKLDEVLGLEKVYNAHINETVDFLTLIKSEILESIYNKNFLEFKGIGKKKSIANYFITRFASINNFAKSGKGNNVYDIINETKYMNSECSKKFEENANIYNNKNNEYTKEEKNEALSRNAIISFVCSAPGEILYSLLNFKKNYDKTVASGKKHGWIK